MISSYNIERNNESTHRYCHDSNVGGLHAVPHIHTLYIPGYLHHWSDIGIAQWTAFRLRRRPSSAWPTCDVEGQGHELGAEAFQQELHNPATRPLLRLEDKQYCCVLSGKLLMDNAKV